MSLPSHVLIPRAVTRYFTVKYQIQPGRGICDALGCPDAPNNFYALEAWVKCMMARYTDLEPDDALEAIEADLLADMYEAEILNDLVETVEVRKSLFRLTRPRSQLPEDQVIFASELLSQQVLKRRNANYSHKNGKRKK